MSNLDFNRGIFKEVMLKREVELYSVYERTIGKNDNSLSSILLGIRLNIMKCDMFSGFRKYLSKFTYSKDFLGKDNKDTTYTISLPFCTIVLYLFPFNNELMFSKCIFTVTDETALEDSYLLYLVLYRSLHWKFEQDEDLVAEIKEYLSRPFCINGDLGEKGVEIYITRQSSDMNPTGARRSYYSGNLMLEDSGKFKFHTYVLVDGYNMYLCLERDKLGYVSTEYQMFRA